MHTIIAIALVLSGAQAFLQCFDYCKLISYNQPMKWRPDCNCSVMIKEKVQINPLLGDTSNLLYEADASSIYYEPAERYRLSFLDQPFYLTNPTVPTIPKQSLSKSHSEGREINRTAIKNNKRSHIHKIKIETEELPLYLDIDIHNAAGKGRLKSQNLLKNKEEDFQRTENDLMKCIDLNVLIISLKYGVSDDTIEILNSKNMEQYSSMSDSDLMAVLKEKCDLPASVIEQSLQEIKGNWPKKTISTARHNNSLVTEEIYESRQKDFIKFSKDITTDAPYVKQIIANDSNIGEDYINDTTFFYGNASNNFGTDTTSPLVKDAKITFSYSNNEDIFHGQDDAITTKYYQITTKKTIDDRSSKNNRDYQERTAFQEEKSNSNNVFTTDLPFSEISTDLVSASEKETIADADLLFISQYISEQKEKNIDEINLDMISANPMDNLTRMSGDNSDIKNLNNVDKVNDELIIKENAIVNDITTTRVNRTQNLEGEYQIPKIISKELPNNTYMSEVDGNETIPNLDFVAYDDNLLNNSLENTSQNFDDVTKRSIDGDFIKSSEFTTALNVGQKITDDENIQAFSSDELRINGKLFFQYGRNKIPARFVQNSDGEIDVAIDGASICDELFKREENKSLLVMSLCNCVQSHNCTHL